VTLKDGSKVRRSTSTSRPRAQPPADELARLALAGEILDIGIQVVDCIGEKAGKPTTIHYGVVGPTSSASTSSSRGHVRVVRHLHSRRDLRRAHRHRQDRPAGRHRPELLDRPARDEFIAEMGRREMPVTYRVDTQIN